MKYILFSIFIAISFQAEAVIQRSAKAKYEFRQLNPCPSTWSRKGACPGYVIDHIKPLCAGGADYHTNMQWQELAESKIKDKEEWKLCRSLKKTN